MLYTIYCYISIVGYKTILNQLLLLVIDYVTHVMDKKKTRKQFNFFILIACVYRTQIKL